MPVSFLQELLRINTSNPPGNERRISELLVERCEQSGMKGRIVDIEDSRSNFELQLKGSGTSGKTLMFCGHIDTISPGKQPWTHPPYGGELVGDRLYGRGASDMKSGLAAMLLAVEELHKGNVPLKGDIVFLATAGEEVDSCGARHYHDMMGMDDIDAIVIGEPTNEKVVIGHKGALWLEVKTYGKTAHGSMPEQGVNAIDYMSHIIQLIESYKLEWHLEKRPLGKSSMAITQIGGGIQTNVIPDECFIHIDIRSIPPQSHNQLVQELNTRLDEIALRIPSFKAECKVLLNRTSVLTSPAATLIKDALAIRGLTEEQCAGVSYYTDASVLNPHSEIPTLIYGPGDEKLAHQPDEWVDVPAYLRSIAFYKALAVRFLNEEKQEEIETKKAKAT
ncbi:M20 family metallopeptidase [Aneurinibacillus migulanus]|uniref:M20 family metallopeptidase n=1 Tax=Aneurinibacillus migulanus TaxID=47500 RepID=UPI00209EDF03|nr:M20 family metallopeptidase [Aneurinibacillus migulanus]MCP1356337.1 M20 family metallopeptidase [Aneurinibacillus migulanus]